MSYALLWIEALVVALLWVAMLVGVAAQLRWKSGQAALAVVSVLPILLFAGLVFFSVLLRFSHHLENSWLAYSASLLIACLIGTIALLAKMRSATDWPRARLGMAFLTAFAIAAMTLWNIDLAVRAQAGTMQTQAGALLLAASPPNVDDSANAAIVYEKVFARMKADPGLAKGKSMQFRDTQDVTSAEARDVLSRHAATIKMLREAGTLAACRFDHDYARPSISMLLPELPKVHSAALLLQLDANRELADGHIEPAMADLTAMYKLGRNMGAEPILISELVAFATDHMIMAPLEKALPMVTRPQELAGLNLGDAGAEPRMLRRSLRGEEAMGLSIFADLAGGRATLPGISALSSSQAPAPSFDVASFDPASLLLRVFLLSDDVSAFRELMERYQQQSTVPFYPTDANLAAENQNEVRQMHRGLITSMMAPALSRALKQTARAQAMHSAALVAVAMTRYRLDHGNYPASLDKLVPAYLDDVPVDPFDGKPLRLAHTDAAWRIYSIGPDGKDDGGTPTDDKTQAGDLVFTLKR